MSEWCYIPLKVLQKNTALTHLKPTLTLPPHLTQVEFQPVLLSTAQETSQKEPELPYRCTFELSTANMSRNKNLFEQNANVVFLAEHSVYNASN